MSAFMNELAKNGETGVPQAFRRSDGEPTTVEDLSGLLETLAIGEVAVKMYTHSLSARGREVIVKTVSGIPPEVLELVSRRNRLGEIAADEIFH